MTNGQFLRLSSNVIARTPCLWTACAKTETVMLSAAKHLSPWGDETLRCAQSDKGKFLSSAEAAALSRSEGEAISLLRHEGDCFAPILPFQ
jgi:hypothetical protein